MSATDAAILTAVLASLMSFATAWLGFRSTAANEARKQATAHIEAFYGRLVDDNRRLSDENQQHEARMGELTAEVVGLNRRVGTYEADLARLQRENESQREEIDRLANRLTQETLEKRQLAEHLMSEQREKRELLKRVVKLEATLAGMAGVIVTAGEDDGP